MPRQNTLILTTLLCAAVGALGACGGDDGMKPAAPGATSGKSPAEPAPPGSTAKGSNAGGSSRGGATSSGDAIALPKLPELTDARARQALETNLTELIWDDRVRSGLLYMAKLGDRSMINRIHTELLKKEDDFYPQDISGAAMGLEALSIYGESDIAPRIVALAQEGLEFDDVDAYVVEAMGQLGGMPQQTAVEPILMKLSDYGDPEVDEGSLALLASWRSAQAAPLFLQFANDEQADDPMRGFGVAGLLALGDENGAKLADELLKIDSVLDPQAVMMGFRIAGVTETIPHMKKLVQEVITADEYGFEPEAFCLALLEIYPDGDIGEHAEFVKWIWEEIEEPYAAITLWRSGRDEYAPLVAEEIARAVSGVGIMDVGDAVQILEWVGDRGVGRTPAFKAVVSAAAQITATAKKPSRQAQANAAAGWLNVAGAYAWLKSAE